MTELWQNIILGLRPGSGIALVAVGIVLIYRGSGVLNFAQGSMGMFGAYAYYELRGTVPTVLATIVAVLCGAALGLLCYVLVARWLGNKSELTRVVATLGILATLQGLAVVRYGTDVILVPPLIGTSSSSIDVLGARVAPDTLLITGAVVVIALACASVFSWSQFGSKAIALREAPAAAAAVAISPHPIGIMTWAAGGGVAALAGVLLTPVIGLTPTTMTLLVVPALAAGLIGRFESFILAALVGIAIGAVQLELQLGFNVEPTYTQAIPFVVIIAALVARGRYIPGRGAGAIGPRAPLAEDDRPKWLSGSIALIVAVMICTCLGPAVADAMVTSLVVGLLGLSVFVLTGLAGQLSLAPYAFAGVGALTAAKLSHDWNLPFLVALPAGAVVGVVIGLLVGLPAVRVRGLNLAIATIGMAVLVETVVLQSPWATNNGFGINIHPAELFGLDIDSGDSPQRYALVCLVVFALVYIAMGRVRRSISGRRYLAVRANERGAASIGMAVPAAKLAAFGISAGIAGMAGVLMTYRVHTVSLTEFTVANSITLISMVVIAGVGFRSGAAAAGIFITGGFLAYFVSVQLGLTVVNEWIPVAFGVWVISSVIQNPDGFMPMYARLVNTAIKPLRRLRFGSSRARGTRTPRHSAPAVDLDGHVGKELHVTSLTVRYGSVTAVNDLSLVVRGGEICGVIGPNGAGKTTLIDAISGFARISSGSVQVGDVDMTLWSPTKRARSGLGRTFQNLELFEDLTVRANLLAACDSRSLSHYVVDLFVRTRADLPGEVAHIARLLGIEQELDVVVSDLPQGTQRLVAVARAISAGAGIICLDEPAAGLGGAERARLAGALTDVVKHRGVGLLLVDHNVDIVGSVCDRVVAIDFGRIVTEGPAQQVLTDPRVAESYLGVANKEELLESTGE